MIGLSGTLRGQQIANEREGNTMTIKLPPHAIATDHPEHPAEKWSAAELSWIAARDKAFLAHVKDAIEAYKQQQGEAVPFGHVTVRRLRGRLENHVDQYHFYPAGESPYLDNVDECHTVYTHPAQQPLSEEHGPCNNLPLKSLLQNPQDQRSSEGGG